MQLPPSIPNKKAQATADELRRLEAERHKAASELDRLERSKVAAVEQDKKAYAAAIRAEKADPGEKTSDKAEKAITDARRRHEALGVAVTEARGDLEAAIRENRQELERTAEERVTRAREEFGRAVEQLAEEHGRLGEALAFKAWLANFPTANYGAGGHAGMLPSLLGRNGDPLAVGAALAALSELAEEPKPARPVGAMPTPTPAAA